MCDNRGQLISFYRKKKVALRSSFFLLPFFLLFYALSQKPALSYSTYLRQYADAQSFYDRATGLSKFSNYGAKQEAEEKQWNEKALKAFTSLYKALPTGTAFHDSLRFHLAFKIGELQHYFENFDEAARYYQQAVAIKERTTLPDSLLFKPLLYAGIIFYNQNEFDTAIKFFKRAEAVQAAYDNVLTEGERLYNILGVLYYERGNYKQAQNYFEKALVLLPRSNPYYKELFVNYRINLAQLHMRLEEYDQANKIYKDLLPYKVSLNEIYHNIGSLNLALGHPADAITYFRKVSYQSNKIVRLYTATGQAFFSLSLYDSAWAYYQKALTAYKSLGTNADPVGYGLVLKSIGDYHRHFGKDSEALHSYQRSVHQFYPSFARTGISDNPEEFSGVFSYINLFNALTAKAEAWHDLYLQRNDSNVAQEELNVYQSAFKLIDYVEKTYESDEARLFLTKTIAAVHDKPINTTYQLYLRSRDKKYLSLLYTFDQQNKAAVLALNRQLNTTLDSAASPMVQKERALKREITRLSIKAAQTADSTREGLNSRIRDYEIELGKLRQSAYPQASFRDDVPSLASLQNTFLDAKTVLVSYHVSPEKITTLVITKGAAKCYQQALPKKFTTNVQQVILSLKTPTVKPVKEATVALYNLLLGDVLLTGKDQLIIIPDDVLAYLPFESLQNKEGKFLIETLAVQYQFSTALLAKNETDFSSAETLSFAPFATQSYTDSLPVLPASAQEIEGKKGKRFIDTAATKEKFLFYSRSYPIVHLATHAVARNGADDFSYIAFAQTKKGEDNLLYAQEIYNLRLQQTSLVILSACETGAGSLVKGEGVLSLSRAFAYAGCPNVITSLWKADDFSTAYLTGHIHRYLKDGCSITNAVRQAKLDYLNDKTINPRLKQPYYWSHLVFVGAYQPEKTVGFYWAGAIALLLLLFFFAHKKKSRMAGR